MIDLPCAPDAAYTPDAPGAQVLTIVEIFELPGDLEAGLEFEEIAVMDGHRVAAGVVIEDLKPPRQVLGGEDEGGATRPLGRVTHHRAADYAKLVQQSIELLNR
jgi:hypothetical protein